MGRKFDISCENCSRHDRGLSPTMDDWLHCSRCHGFAGSSSRPKVLQRLFRIRPRRHADGNIHFERYE